MSSWHRGGKGGYEPPVRIRARESRVVELAAAAYTQMEIAGREGISQSAVSQILARVDDREAKRNETKRAAARMRLDRSLAHIWREAVHGFEKSKTGRLRRRQRKSSDGRVSQEVIIDEHPDPRFLELARRAQESRATLLGLNAPAPVEPVDVGRSDLSDEALLASVNALLDVQATHVAATERNADSGSAPLNRETPHAGAGHGDDVDREER